MGKLPLEMCQVHAKDLPSASFFLVPVSDSDRQGIWCRYGVEEQVIVELHRRQKGGIWVVGGWVGCVSSGFCGRFWGLKHILR